MQSEERRRRADRPLPDGLPRREVSKRTIVSAGAGATAGGTRGLIWRFYLVICARLGYWCKVYLGGDLVMPDLDLLVTHMRNIQVER